MEQRNNTKKVESLHANVLETMKKYTFLEGYLKQPDVNTGKSMPTFLKIMSTILYLRQRLGFQVIPNDEQFYNDIKRNDYTNFQNIKEDVEILNLLVCFVSMACGLIDDMIKDDDESRDKIINTIRQYYYKNKDFIATI
jgi:hypothetical protein